MARGIRTVQFPDGMRIERATDYANAGFCRMRAGRWKTVEDGAEGLYGGAIFRAFDHHGVRASDNRGKRAWTAATSARRSNTHRGAFEIDVCEIDIEDVEDESR